MTTFRKNQKETQKNAELNNESGKRLSNIHAFDFEENVAPILVTATVV
jgi:hypothetical protein